MRRAFHDRKDRVTEEKRAAPASRPLRWSFLLLTRAFATRLGLLHPFGHFRFHCIKVETRAPLHRRVIEKGLEVLAHHLLDEQETPELELKPVEVLLSAFFRPLVRPPHALKRIEAK